MDLLHILTTTTVYIYRQGVGSANDNLNFDLKVLKG